jgi:anti-sigma factor RsiW
MSDSQANGKDEQRLHLDLQAYFDGEMNAAEKERFEAELKQNSELATELAEIGIMRELVVGELEAEAKDVPEARFEQIWDEIDASIDRESRLQESAGTRPSLWARVLPFLRPAALPMAATAAAAAFVVLVVNASGDPSNSEPATASNEAVQAPAPKTADAEPTAPQAGDTATPPTQIAQADDGAGEDADDSTEFDAPRSNEAEVERIEFGGHSGHIEQLEGSKGTTTVIWIEEDDEPVDSERSL